ncbi:hypothetical protein HN018_06820 [Lichenicola cladoniae]|uniref:Uncharacterized protein n=1 Tax=Lichenicola cladoniae TaxID=1484109 RepID=A0A6M8HMZ2_9PROT|nr:hypothetical protein [Lichenicola cladoniae]NPD67285.1 hypothetical protein [Acetobacteraceae bacterium]QKE89789.1 hypothetical protein HN018_06820 [Lichenicola cladoniae]
MLTNDECSLIEDDTGITPQQLRRLERLGYVRNPLEMTISASEVVAMFRASEARRPVFGCPSEAH